MRNLRPVLSAIGVIAASLCSTAPALAQGCILLRQTSPLFGTTGSSGQGKGTWNITFTGRNSTADQHYNGTEHQIQRQVEQTFVVNRQNSLTATISYQLTDRVSLHAGIPWIEASWGIPSPRTGGPAARANENARGLGDVTTLARFTLLDPIAHTWNLQIGGGVKFPTGNNKAIDTFPDNTGNNNFERYVDISVHPGDGGWGIIFDLLGYKALGDRVVAFGSGTWLASPRNTGTASRGNLVSNLNPSNVNTVSDQFVFRAGTSVSILKKTGEDSLNYAGGLRELALSIAWRMEGVPRYDVFGRSDGFRRPGVEMYWEPGVTLNVGRHSMSFNVPIGYYFNRFRNPYTGTRGDSTFPEVVAIATYSVRLSKSEKHAVMTDDAAAAEQPDASQKRDEKPKHEEPSAHAAPNHKG